mgnify:CR=1 FL=1
MHHQAHAVVERLAVGEGAVAALVRNDPDARHEGALPEPVQRPQHEPGQVAAGKGGERAERREEGKGVGRRRGGREEKVVDWGRPLQAAAGWAALAARNALQREAVTGEERDSSRGSCCSCKHVAVVWGGGVRRYRQRIPGPTLTGARLGGR